MKGNKISLFPKLKETVQDLSFESIPSERKEALQPLVDYIQGKVNRNETVNLIFICTHNSRRSQFAQIWAQTFAHFFGIDVECYSGGVEVTIFNERAVESLKRAGFKITVKGKGNPVYFVLSSRDADPISVYSKLYDDPLNTTSGFAAVMTCAHADENCPYIPGAENRMFLPYDDPKEFDNTSQEEAKYDERSMQIAGEMFYVFSKIKI